MSFTIMERALLALFFSLLAFSRGGEGRGLLQESLVMRPLWDGRTVLHWRFEISDSVSSRVEMGIPVKMMGALLPKQLVQVADSVMVDSLDVSMRKGYWDHDRWGMPPVAAPNGAELRASFLNVPLKKARQRETGAADKSYMERWAELKLGLSGLLCSSFDLIDEKNTYFSERAFPGQIVGSLGREAFCTENLTPWLALLPCRNAAGLASLLSPLQLFTGDYHSMTLALSRSPDDMNAIKVVQTFTAVVGKSTFTRGKDLAWLLADHLGKQVRMCPLASSTQVIVQLPSPSFTLTQNAPTIRSETSTMSFAAYRAHEGQQILKLEGIGATRTGLGSGIQSPILLSKVLAGSGRAERDVVLSVKNTQPRPLRIHILDILPWYVQVHSRSILIDVDGASPPPAGTVLDSNISLATPNGRPNLIEIDALLLANATMRIRVHVDLVFLQFQQFPPDANRGFDVLPAVVSLPSSSPDGNDDDDDDDDDDAADVKGRSMRIYSEGILLNMPQPDISMPYNVITLSSTIVAFFFGSVLNLLVRPSKKTTPDS